jgi:hypothetical protein
MKGTFILLMAGQIASAAASAQFQSQPVFELKDLSSFIRTDSFRSMQLPPVTARISDVECIPGTCTTLPVVYFDIRAKRLNDYTVRVEWETTEEINNAGFEVERSAGNQNGFTVRAYRQAQQSIGTINHYEFIDSNSLSVTSWYRLNQKDIDGRSEYSRAVPVEGIETRNSLVIAPNPGTTFSNVYIFINEDKEAWWSLVDSKGSRVEAKMIRLNKGGNTIPLPLGQLPAGLYHISVIFEGGNLSGKLVKR